MIKGTVMPARYQVELLPSPQLQSHAQVKQAYFLMKILREDLRKMVDFIFFIT